MKKKSLLILTSRFPYLGGEYFLETEHRFWWKDDGVDVYLMPFFKTNGIRDFPSWAVLRSENSRNENRFGRIKYLCATFFSSIFWFEIFELIKRKQAKLSNLRRALLVVSRVLQIKDSLELFAREVGGIDLVYSYWNNTSCYAAALLKKKGLVRKIVSRAHGSDLYRYALKNDYMPLKDQLVSQFDLVAAVSEGGRNYYSNEYRILRERVIVSRLGVEIDGRQSGPSGSRELSIVSISNCVEIKRVEVIAAGVLLYASENPEVNIRWVHIGDGPTLGSLKEFWESSAIGLDNVSGSFVGRLENKAVIDFLVQNQCDLILNASASEGIPVSLMEAMSLGIPAIAPNIGGIPELVSSSCGYLLPPMPTSIDIARGLTWGLRCGKDPAIRHAAAKQVAEQYSASRNYSEFYRLILSHA